MTPLRLKRLVPWRFKIAAKLVLSQLPVRYAFWKGLHLFEHGRMESPAYAFEVCRTHFDQFLPHRRGTFDVLELGPGDAVTSAMIARAFGARATVLVDEDRFATGRMATYGAMRRFLADRGLACPASESDSVEGILAACNSEYLTGGLNALRRVPSESVDFIWSNAVLEHVRLKDFEEMQMEMRRILRPGGLCSHQIDFRDHLNMELNHLRYSRDLWESDLFAGAGFYTNRLRLPQMLRTFERNGFAWRVVHQTRWHKPPLARELLAGDFRGFSDEELCVSGAHVVLW